MIITPEGYLDWDGKVSQDTQTSLSNQAYKKIRRKIIFLELPPGSIINESDLQGELGLGRTPIREALQRLALEKMITIVPRRGIFVTDIGIADLQHLFEVRLVMEALAARLASQRGTAEHWQRMEAVLSGLPGDDQADNEAWIAADELCHRIIYEAANNKFLRDSLITLYALSLRIWYFSLTKIGDMRRHIQDHRKILEALKAGDSPLASQLIERHILAFQEEIQSAMLGTPILRG